MTHVLDDKKQTTVKKDRVICKAHIEAKDFTKLYDNRCPARFFIEGKTFIGVAIRKDGDEDNVREAIHIAESKMERQYYKYILACFKKERTGLSEFERDIDECIAKNKRNIESINKHIIDIVDSLK